MELTLPTATDHERIVLGAILMNESHMHDARPVLEVDDFAFESHRRMWRRACELYDAGTPVDRITLWDILHRHGEGESVGGMGYIVSLDDGTPETPHIDTYIGVLKEKATLRKIIFAARDIATRCMTGTEKASDLLTAIGAIGSGLSLKGASPGLQSAGEVMDEIGITSLLAPRKDQGLMFPWSWMNRLTCGMLPAELWILAGHTSTGKTSAMLQHAVGVARKGIGVAVFSLEVGKRALLQKACYQLARVDSEKIKQGLALEPRERTALRDAAAELAELPLYMDTTATTTSAIHAAVRRRVAKNKLGHVIVDYLQLLGDSGRFGTRAQAVGANAWALKILGTDFQIPVLLLSQFSRQKKNANGEKVPPELGDLKESGDIENHANGVWFIHRPSDEDADQISVQFMLPKQRDGRRNVYTDLWFMPKYQRFEEKYDG